uniref:Uncharacterized protein n=1 Tax=Tanacetum cinerariifolium TaxID=118510 RepID=A0A6L2LQ93_TANCI|nr:hypothetical protein [Tanacetum cinerariifolium]
MYLPQYSKDMYQNTICEESLVEVTAPPPKPSRRRQKRLAIVRNEDAPRCTLWTNEEEIALRKGWVHVSEYSAKGNARKTDGFWTEVLDYLGKKKINPVVERTICLKWWEQVVPKYSYPNDAKKSKTSGSSSFNTESNDASFNLNFDAGDEDENEVQEIPRSMGRDKARGSKKKGAG